MLAIESQVTSAVSDACLKQLYVPTVYCMKDNPFPIRSTPDIPQPSVDVRVLHASFPLYPSPMQVMVANIRCGEILNDQLISLQEDQAWTSLVENAQQHLVPTFGSQASNLLGSCLAGVLYTNPYSKNMLLCTLLCFTLSRAYSHAYST